MKIPYSLLRSLAFVGTAAVMLSSQPAHAATVTWSTANATTTSWALGSNWVGGVAPVNGDDVVVNADGTFDPTGYNGAELNSLTLTGSTNLSISGVKVGAGGVFNNTTTRSFFLTGTTTLLADSVWGGTRTIFTDQVTGNFKITANNNASRFEGNSPNWTGGLDVRSDAAMADGFAAGTITPWGTGTITMINQKLDGTTNTNARLNFASNANNITPGTAYVLANNIVLSDPDTLNFAIQQATNMAAAGDTHYYELSGDITGAVNSARTLSFTNIFSSAATTPAVFTLTGTNTYAARTIIGTNTTLQIGAGGTIGTLGSNTGNITNDGTLAINRSDAVSVANVITGAGGFEQRGGGTTTLSGNNTYTGTTTVSAGTLLINGNQTTATGTVTVTSGATLGGNGTIGGAVDVSGTLAPGNSIGTISTGNLTLTSTGVLDVELGRSGITPVSDRTNVTGTVNLASGADLKLTLFTGLTTPVLNDIFFLVSNDSSEAITGVFTKLNGLNTTLNEGSQFSWNSLDWKITYTADFGTSSFTGGNDLAIQVIPEPTTWALLAASLTTIMVLRRRRQT